MNDENLLLTEAARVLGVKPYQITYAISVGRVADVGLWIAHKRIFRPEDIANLRKHFENRQGIK